MAEQRYTGQRGKVEQPQQSQLKGIDEWADPEESVDKRHQFKLLGTKINLGMYDDAIADALDLRLYRSAIGIALTAAFRPTTLTPEVAKRPRYLAKAKSIAVGYDLLDYLRGELEARGKSDEAREIVAFMKKDKAEVSS